MREGEIKTEIEIYKGDRRGKREGRKGLEMVGRKGRKNRDRYERDERERVRYEGMEGDGMWERGRERERE